MSFNNFQKIHDYYKAEIADTDVAWTVTSLDTSSGNVSTDVTWASSAALAIPAAVVLVALTTL